MMRLVKLMAMLVAETAGLQAAGPPRGDADSSYFLQVAVDDVARNASSARKMGVAADELQLLEGFPFSATLRKAIEGVKDWARSRARKDKVPVSAARAIDVLQSVYDGDVNDAHSIQIDRHKSVAEVVARAGNGTAETYGEILPKSVVDILAHAGAKPGLKYYDLGSGFGKTAVLAWIMGLDATGVELATGRHEVACKAVTRLQRGDATKELSGSRGPGLRFVHGSFLDVDFSDADIVFTDNLCFPKEITTKIAEKARHMKPGAKVVSILQMPEPGFRVDSRLSLATSWASDSEFFVQTVLGEDGPHHAEHRTVQQQDVCELGKL